MQQRRRVLGWSTAAVLTATLAVSGCGSSGSDDAPTPGLANPASEYCAAQGGEVEIVTDDDGQSGVCHLPDGTSVDEWEYFRENHPDASTP